MASEFSVRCACKFRRLTGGKSRNLQDTYGGKGTARCAAVLCGISYIEFANILAVKRMDMTGFMLLGFEEHLDDDTVESRDFRHILRLPAATV